MITIKLKHGFFIEAEEKNFTLKSEHINTKTKEPAIKIHGYYMTLEQVIKEYIKLATLDANDDETIELMKYLETYKAMQDELSEVLKNG